MTSQKKQLAVIVSGDQRQAAANAQQFRDLKRLLKRFHLVQYRFTTPGRTQLLADYARGKIDIVLKNAYGRGHENEIERFLDTHHIPYMGSGAAATLRGTSKNKSKKIFRKNKIPVVDDIFVSGKIWKKSPHRTLQRIEQRVGYPCMIKDVVGTDSHGLFFVANAAACTRAMQKIVQSGSDVIVEQFIPADVEVTCMVVGNKRPIAYQPVSISSGEPFFSVRVKNTASFRVQVPAPLPKTVLATIQKVSRQAHRALGCRTFSRADILVRGKHVYLLEVDVHPGFRAKSPTLMSARYHKQSPDQLFDTFYHLSMEI